MKKLLKILMPFFIASSVVFSGCKKKETKDSRVALSFGDMHASESKEVTMTNLKDSVKSKENFLFVVTSNGCSCWGSFQPVLNSYLSENKALCYRMSYNDFEPYAHTFKGLESVSSGTTTFAIFENGEVKTTLCSSDNSRIMYNTASFAKYMSETVKLPLCYLITMEDVTAIKASGKNAVIYFERTGCGDCQSILPGILREYSESHLGGNKIFVVDFQPFYDYSNYGELKKEYGLSTHNNPTYGYGDGVFPYFSYISNGDYASGAVIYNEKISFIDNKYIVSESYYTEERAVNLEYTNTVLVGKEVPPGEIDSGVYNGVTYYSWNHGCSDKTYKPILHSFLDTYLPRVDFSF